jgi:hypothetical protein
MRMVSPLPQVHLHLLGEAEAGSRRYRQKLIIDVIRALTKAIETIKAGRHDPLEAHQRVKGMYAWSDVASRTEAVYQAAISSPRKDIFEILTR